MKKAIFNMLLSSALIVLCTGVALAGLHAMPGSNGAEVMHQEIRPAVNVTAAPVASAAPSPVISATITAVPSGAAGAELVGYGTDKDTYNRGDKANGYITLKNTGNTVISDVTVSVSVATTVPALGNATIGSKDFKVSGLNIQPGETKKAEFSVDIPGEYRGVSTAGDYDLNGKVLVGGSQVGSFTKHIKIV